PSSSGIIYTSTLIEGKLDPSIPGSTLQLVTVLSDHACYTFTLESAAIISQTKVVVDGVRPLRLTEALDHSRRMFVLNGSLRISSTLTILVVPGQPFSLNDDNIAEGYVFALAPNGA